MKKTEQELIIDGLHQRIEFRSKGGRLIAKSRPKVLAHAPEGSELQVPVLCFQDDGIVERNLIHIGASRHLDRGPLWGMRIESYNTKESLPILVERHSISGAPILQTRWYVSSGDVLLNGNPVVIVKSDSAVR